MSAPFVMLAAFILIPTVEIYTFVQVGSEIGALTTILITVLTAIAGTILLRTQGLSLLMRINGEMNAGRVPNEELFHGAFIVLAGIMLLIPGFISDTLGLVLFIPAVRSAIIATMKKNIKVREVNIKMQGGDRNSNQSNRDNHKTIDLQESEWHRDTDNNDDESPWKK
ncbi:FxsA family protein [Polycladidibacter stylochi]|uniref:FxsA family protein n=1 Tax=Polycladidibacter stylochi TaxID=1807766 RepID=UPI00082F4645|nr:FxsA family protein [Pseudovibrio stylochi]